MFVRFVTIIFIYYCCCLGINVRFFGALRERVLALNADLTGSHSASQRSRHDIHIHFRRKSIVDDSDDLDDLVAGSGAAAAASQRAVGVARLLLTELVARVSAPCVCVYACACV